jgi:O-methyltransferase domain
VFALDAETARFYAGAARAAAGRIGLFTALPGDVDELARRTGTRARRLRALLDALGLDGTLLRDGAVYRMGTPGTPSPAVPPHGWGLLGEVLLCDRPLDEPEPADSRAFQEHLLRANAARAADLWRRLPAAGPLLDLGGGLGAFTAAFLDAHAGQAATLVDRPSVCALARLGDRVRLCPGDLFDAPLGSDFGTVLLANLLHLYPPDACRALLARAASALAPEGRLVVVDLAIEDDRSGPPAAVYFALNMALYTEGGTVHGIPQLTSWVQEATGERPKMLALEGTPDVIAITVERGR